MNVYGKIKGSLRAGSGTITGVLSPPAILIGAVTIPNAVLPPAYAGPYTVAPSAEAQTLNTLGLYMQEDITIEPIPSNYGLITWDGLGIRVS